MLKSQSELANDIPQHSDGGGRGGGDGGGGGGGDGGGGGGMLVECGWEHVGEQHLN